jgi:hypothetical protein
LTIEDTSGAPGTILSGPSANCTFRIENLPKAVGVVGKDAKVINITHDGVQVETSITTCPDGRFSSTPRICHRERTLRKM